MVEQAAWCNQFINRDGENERLNELLDLSSSAYQLSLPDMHIIDRVPQAVQASYTAAATPNDQASAELQEAWSNAYGRNPDSSDAWDHAIRAVESVLCPIVTPNDSQGQLGKVIAALNDQKDRWEVILRGENTARDVENLVGTLRLIWTNPDRHAAPPPPIEQARAAVMIAVMITQWARDGWVLRRKSNPPK